MGLDLKWKYEILNRLAQAMTSAHTLNIQIGDFHGLNILVHIDRRVRIIDVDAFQTPGYPHSGSLLQDIVDFALQTYQISNASDYFAFGIVAFQLLTYTHPFKGIHKTIPLLADRMRHRKSLLIADPNLIIPRCYEPIADIQLLHQFERLFIKSERFLLQINTTTAISNTLYNLIYKH